MTKMRLRITDILAQRGIKIKDLAQKMGIRTSNLNAAINHGNPTVETLYKIAQALGVEVHELFTDRLPSQQDGIVYVGGSAYALVRVPNTPQVRHFVTTDALQSAIKDFVHQYLLRGYIASLNGFFETKLFTIMIDAEGETERLLLSVEEGTETPYCFGFEVDDYQLETDGTYFDFDEDAIAKEMLHEILGIDRGKQMYLPD